MRLELTQDDDPYLKSSDLPSSLTLGQVKLALPVRETAFARAPDAASSPAQVVAAATLGAAADHSAPVAQMLAPFVASDVSRSARFPIAWRASDIGSGVKAFEVQARRTSGRTPQRPWRTILRATTRTRAFFRGRGGQTYHFRVRAVDRAGNVSRFASGSTIVPTSERTAGARYRGPWHVRALRGSFGRRAITCVGRRCRLVLRWRGADVALIGATGPRGGRVRIRLDRRTRTISLRSPRNTERRVIFKARRRAGGHRLTLVTVRGRVVLDGFALRDRRR